MLVAWLIFPALLVVLCCGCGLVVERAVGRPFPGSLVPSLGLALIVVVVYFILTFPLTRNEIGAAVAPWVVLVLALIGFALGTRRLRESSLDRGALAVGIVTYLALILVLVLIGEATWTGYYQLNDSVYQFVLVDWLFDNGYVEPTGPGGAFEASAKSYIGSAYPLGAHMPLGVGQELVGEPVPWLFQPYLALVLALAATALYSILAGVKPTLLRGLASFVAVMSSLVYSYFLAGNIKEISMLWALIATVATVAVVLRPRPDLRAAIAVAMMLVAGFTILNIAAVPWLALSGLVFAGALIRGWTRDGWRRAWPKLGALAAALILVGVLSFDAIQRFADTANKTLTDNASDLGNLSAPLSLLHVFGTWPRPDFRFPLDTIYNGEAGYALVGIAIASAVAGLVWVIRRRRYVLALLFLSATLAGTVLLDQGSPYADAKTLAIASPVVVLAAMLGAVSLHDAGRKIEAWLLAGAVAFGVLWSDAINLAEPKPAPRDRYEELAAVADHISDSRVTLFTAWDEFFAYFARDANATGLPYRSYDTRKGIPPRSGERERYPFDLDELVANYVQQWPTLVLARSPAASRPPANFQNVAVSEHYDVWRKDPESFSVLEHHPLGDPLDPGRVPSCGFLRELATRAAARGAELAYVERARLPALFPPAATYPEAWGPVDGDPSTLIPRVPGAVAGSLVIPKSGDYEVWMQAQLDRPATVEIGDAVFPLEQELAPPGQFLPVGEASLSRGRARVRIDLDRPPSIEGAFNGRIGPLILAPVSADLNLQTIDPSDVDRLCGRRLDWVELVTRS